MLLLYLTFWNQEVSLLLSHKLMTAWYHQLASFFGRLIPFLFSHSMISPPYDTANCKISAVAIIKVHFHAEGVAEPV